MQILYFILVICIAEVISAPKDDPTIDKLDISVSRPNSQLKDREYIVQFFYKANFFEAMQFCQYHGMKLATINSEKDNEDIKNAIKESPIPLEHFWTSGNDLAVTGKMHWLSTGKPLSFTNWITKEPNNYSRGGEVQHCLVIRTPSYQWDDDFCSVKNYFICET